MEKVTLRAILLFLLGGFLLLAGVFMDAMGRQIRSSPDPGAGIHFNPLVLVGRFLLTVGVAMLLAAGILVYRDHRNKKNNGLYERTSTTPDQIVECQADAVSTPHLHQQPRLQSDRPKVQTFNISPTCSTPIGDRNTIYLREVKYQEIPNSSRPASVAISPYNSNLEAQNPRFSGTYESTRDSAQKPRYSGTYEPTRDFAQNPRYSGTYDSTRNSASLRSSAVFTPIYSPSSQGSTSSLYSSRGQEAMYVTIPLEHISEDCDEYNWKSHLTKEQTRRKPANSINNDEPPPYESQEPPPYYP